MLVFHLLHWTVVPRNGEEGSCNSPYTKVNTTMVQNKRGKKYVLTARTKLDKWAIKIFILCKGICHPWAFRIIFEIIILNARDEQKFLVGVVYFYYLQQATWEQDKTGCCPWCWAPPFSGISSSHYLNILECFFVAYSRPRISWGKLSQNVELFYYQKFWEWGCRKRYCWHFHSFTASPNSINWGIYLSEISLLWDVICFCNSIFKHTLIYFRVYFLTVFKQIHWMVPYCTCD